MNRNIKIFVLCSVILNIFLIGFVVGKYVHRSPGEDVAQLVSGLTSTKRDIANKLLALPSAGDKAKIAELRIVRKGIVDELNAEEFNAEDYQLKLDELERIRAQLKEHYTIAVKEMASNFTLEERRMLVKALVKRRKSRATRSPFTSVEKKR